MTIIIILITGLVSFKAFSDKEFLHKMTFRPFDINNRNEYYRFITHGFVHQDTTHLIVNMITFYFAAQFTEQIFGFLFIPFYLLALVVSSLPDYFKNKNNPYYSALGASGAVNAVLFSLMLFNPWGVVRLYFILPIYFIIFAVLYLAYSIYMSKKSNDNIGHMAHITGAIFGILFTMLVVPNSLNIFVQLLSSPPFLN